MEVKDKTSMMSRTHATDQGLRGLTYDPERERERERSEHTHTHTHYEVFMFRVNHYVHIMCVCGVKVQSRTKFP